MPYARRRYNRRRYRPRRRRVAGLATVPRMMPRSLAIQRHNQVGTKVFWFKQSGSITNANNLPATVFRAFQAQESLLSNPPNGFVALRQLYDQYKVLAFRVRLLPASVGFESTAGTTSNGPIFFLRGNTCVWSDQRPADNVQIPTDIQEVIGDSSAKLIASRRQYARTLYRPRGHPRWGDTQGTGETADDWNGSVFFLNRGASTWTPPLLPTVLWYYTVQWKVIFRGRVTPA